MDASGTTPPVGDTVRKLDAVVLVAVTFMTTAVASAGTGPTPATVNERVWWPDHGVE